MRTLIELRDPTSLVLAVASAAILLVAQEGPLVAVPAGLSVLVFRIVAGAVLRRWGPRPPAPAGQPWYHPLSKRESEVAVLLTEGLTNRQIGERLHSERTVDGHLAERSVDTNVHNIMNKLSEELKTEVNRRAQISAWVAERRARAPSSRPPAK